MRKVLLVAVMWILISIVVSMFGYIIYERIRDLTSSEIPKTVEGKVDLMNVSGETYSPEDVKYFSMSNIEGKGWTLKYHRIETPRQGVSKETRWSFVPAYPSEGRLLTIYDPLPGSFRIENNFFLFEWEHRTGGLLLSTAIAVFLSMLGIATGFLLTRAYLRPKT